MSLGSAPKPGEKTQDRKFNNKKTKEEILKTGSEKYDIIKMQKVLGTQESYKKAENEGWLNSINRVNELGVLLNDKNLTPEEMDAVKTVDNIANSIRRDIKNNISTTLILNNLKNISYRDREKILLIEKKKRTNEGTALRNILGSMGFEMSVGGMSKEEFEVAKERSKSIKIN